MASSNEAPSASTIRRDRLRRPPLQPRTAPRRRRHLGSCRHADPPPPSLLPLAPASAARSDQGAAMAASVTSGRRSQKKLEAEQRRSPRRFFASKARKYEGCDLAPSACRRRASPGGSSSCMTILPTCGRRARVRWSTEVNHSTSATAGDAGFHSKARPGPRPGPRRTPQASTTCASQPSSPPPRSTSSPQPSSP